jgi:RHS repeat-associated protein
MTRFSSIVGMVALILGLGGLGSRPARAEIQNDAIGFSPNHAFDTAEAGENVDLMNGNLTLTIPLGPRYKLADNFNYGVTLYYNSKIWHHECPTGLPPSHTHPCPGTLPPYSDYGLGFSLLPGRVYHDPQDQPWVFRLQLEDGSDHFFCDTHVTGWSASQNCDSFTTDPTHMNVGWSALHDSTPTALHYGWVADTTDGKRIEFGNVLNGTTREALATRISLVAYPAVWVDYSYDTGSNKYRLDEIHDSQDRAIDFIWGNGLTIRVPVFANAETKSTAATADYNLRWRSSQLLFHDPSSGIDDLSQKTVLERIELPGLDPNTESYRFKYERDGWDSYGWLVQRTLPTGAVTDYYFWLYQTSLFRPYHTELKYKVLTLPSTGQSYRWVWDRFAAGTASPQPPDPAHPDPALSYAGSNPYQVSVYDPFNNLTRYEFYATTYNVHSDADCNNAHECRNTWSDGLLKRVSTYAGSVPDSARLVRQVENKWDSDVDSSTQHKMFQYRPSHDGASSLTVNASAINARQLEEKAWTPATGSAPSQTVTVTSSDWYPADVWDPASIVPRQKDEYIDGVLYRSTKTEISPSGGNWAAHRWVQVKDGADQVVSRVDRKFTNGLLKCEVRRKGATNADDVNCAASIPLGDVATVNTYDCEGTCTSGTGALTSTITKGGDVSATASRTISMNYLTYPVTGAPPGNTAFLKKKNYGFTWSAVDRDVDFNTGLTIATRDSAGNMTSYDWDDLGRLLKIQPVSIEKPTIIAYPSLHETDVTQTLTSGDYIQTIYRYDELGRLIRTERRNITGTSDVQRTEYDSAGRITRKSEWATDSTPEGLLKWTTYDYTIYTDLDAPGGSNLTDPLGRIHGVTVSDDPTPLTPTTETSYDGNITTVTVRDIRGWSAGSDTNVTSTTVYTKDALGRLTSVDSSGAGADASYVYDESDNLVEVRLTDPTPPPAGEPTHVQVRHFNYDQLGRLRVASNPESGDMQYTSYDGRGNLLNYTDARGQGFALTYDAADRLLLRKLGSATVLANTYDTSSGHLTQQVTSELSLTTGTPAAVSTLEWGYGAANGSTTCPVTEDGYTGLSGRLSWQKTTIQPWNTALRTEYCQNLLGLPTMVRYPDFSTSQRTRSTVASNYRNGYLQEFGDRTRDEPYATNVYYGPGGAPIEIVRPSVIDLMGFDLRNRPDRFRAIGRDYTVPSGNQFIGDSHGHPNLELDPDGGELGVPPGGGGNGPIYANWDTGFYSYDMSGNVANIGSEQYHYDQVNRLIHASIPAVGQVFSLDFEYDAFGNMSRQQRRLSINQAPILDRVYSMNWQTNRLVGLGSVGYTYDENGNMTSEGGRGFVFDPENRLREVMDPQSGRLGNYHYDGSGYRIRVEADGTETFLFRDASGQVLSEFQRPLGTTSTPVWNKDYIYAFGKSFALIKNQTPKRPLRPWAIPIPPSGDIQGSLRLKWATLNAPDILGYSLKRKWFNGTTLQTTYPPLSAAADHWDDTYPPAPPDSSYLIYTLTAMDTAGNMSAEGQELVVFPYALGNPPAPTGVSGIAGNRSVTIRWNPVVPPHNDLWGYFVYRQGSQLNSVPLTVLEYLDNGVQNGQTYNYAVRAVDTSGRLSLATLTAATPHDGVAPPKPIDVFAEPDRVANQIVVSWRRPVDFDVKWFRVYRSDGPGQLGNQVGADVAASDLVESYSFTDTGVAAGTTRYYSVTAVDESLPANESAPSDQVSARARYLTASPPILIGVSFDWDKRGTTSPDGEPGDAVNNGNTLAENDDVMSAMVQWSGAATVDYNIYRKAPDEARYRWVGTQAHNGTTAYAFYDSTIGKNEYTYYVAAKSGATDETAGSTLPVDGPNHFLYQTDWHTVGVRNITVTDGRANYLTDNRESRFVRVNWSRVVKPDLIGYNVYRKCNFTLLDGVHFIGGEGNHFACEPVWARLNETPVPPDHRFFMDGTTAGLGSNFFYAVRPIGLNGDEGPITKIVIAPLVAPQDASLTDFHVVAATEFVSDVPPSGWTSWIPYDPLYAASISAAAHMNTINGKARTGSASGPPNSLATVHASVDWIKRGLFYGLAMPQEDTRFQVISWSWGTGISPPKDLAGYHVEVAGSPNGPWQRLTKHPVAWWEDHYTAQGVWQRRCGGAAGGCLVYRVIAIDESGNESAPTYAAENPSAALCPQTPEPPQNLRASDGPANGSTCSTHLEWDASANATEYRVYRMIINVYHPSFFYDTKRIVVSTPQSAYSFDEFGDAGDRLTSCSDPDTHCPYTLHTLDVVPPCDTMYLQAFYVTARNAASGESPRSNLVFWKCGEPFGNGYSKLTADPPPTDAIAEVGEAPSETLACWNVSESTPTFPGTDRPVTAPPATLSTTPMLALGDDFNPDWVRLDLHTDHLGTVRAITNAAGGMASRHDYFPFGEEISTQLSHNTHRYTGHEHDQETGLDYMLARYYEAGVGRFLSTDPVAIKPERLRIPQRLNLYIYAANNPIKFFDPTGEDVEVGNRPVKGTLGIGYHAFLVVKPTGANVEKYKDRTDPKTGTITLSGHPKDGKLVRTQNDARDVGKAEQTIYVSTPKGTSMEKFEANVIQASDSYKNDAKYEAKPGPGTSNSNSLVSGTLKAAGSDHTPTTGDLTGYNPGWDQSVELPDATVDDSPKKEDSTKKEEKKQP